jgi:hypothetical protein
MTITDGATDHMRRIWTELGGRTDNTASIGWSKFLRPAAVGAFLTQRRGHGWLDCSIKLVRPGLDTAARRALKRFPGFIPAEPGTTAEVLTPEKLIDQVQRASHRLRLHPDYDTEYLGWLFTELEAVTFRGVPVRHLVVNERGRAIGWYIYYLNPGGISQVLQIAAFPGDVGSVLDHLFWHADSHGAAAVLGRLEAHLIGELYSRRCVLVPTDWCLVSSCNQSLLSLLGTTSSLLTRLDGEWWMGHHGLWFSADVALRHVI